MFFRKIAVVLMCSALTGCGWMRDNPKPTAQIKGETLDLSCLQTTPEQLQKLFAGEYTNSEADQAQISAIWKCLDRSLETFSKHTRGAKSDVYTAKELQLFANRYLPENKPLSATFTYAIFRLKRAVLGGNDAELTHAEIAGLRKKLLSFGVMMGPLAPHVGVLLTPAGQDTREKIVAAAALNKFVLNVADLLGDSANAVPWADLGTFIHELEKYTRVDKPTALTMLHEQLDIYQYFKLLLVGGDEYAIEKSKWRPIFAAISHFYNALFLSNNTVDTLEELSIEVQSSEDEQRRAVEHLNGLLTQYRADKYLSSKRSVDQLTDRWGKALLLNAIIFPRSQGSLALKTFLGSPGLRKLAGYLLDQVKAIQADSKDPDKIQALADNFINFLTQAANENSVNGILTPIDFGSLKDYVQKLRPLFTDDNEFQAALVAIDLFKNAAPILCGKESDSYLPKDLRAVVQKSVDLYLAWRKESKISVFEAIGQSVDIVLRPPAFYSVKLEQVENSVTLGRELMRLLRVRADLNWDQVLSYVRNGFYVKSLVFGSSDRSISGYEVKTLGDLWQPFRRGDDFARSLREVSNLLRDNTFAPVPFDKLIGAVDRFLPANAQIESYGLDTKTLGLLKRALLGGSADVLESKDYSGVARIGANIWARLEPIVKPLPKTFGIGMNADTLAITSAVIDGIADSVEKISYDNLRPLLASVLKQQGYSVRDTTLESFLVGLSHRMLRHQLTPKPARATGFLLSDELRDVNAMLKTIRADWQELELAFKGVAPEATVSRPRLLQQLSTPELRHIVEVMPPILDGKEHLLHISGHGAGQDFTSYDLMYKALVRRLLVWLFPAYQIEADPQKPSSRLTFNDTVDLLEDINDLILDLKLTYGVNPPPVTARKRMQTINIMTKTGNGDDYLDFDETTEFLTMSAGGKVLLDIEIERLIKECKIDTENGAHQFIPYPCLAANFAKPSYFTEVYGQVVPEMVKQFNGYTDAERALFIESMFNSTDAHWREKQEMSFSDFEVFVAVPYYAEGIFERLDTNHNQIIVFSEAMAAFPLFCREIKRAAGPSVKGSCENGFPNQIEAVYGHLLFRGEPPRGLEPGMNLITRIRVILNWLKWLRFWKHLDRSPEIRDVSEPQLQRKDLLKIISNLAMSTDTTQLELSDELESASLSSMLEILPPGVGNENAVQSPK